jgi:MATE family multidrug resistance protein
MRRYAESMGFRRIYGAQARLVLALGLPLVGSHIAQFGLHLTDTIMLGWYGVEDLAAGVLGTTVLFTLFLFGSGFAAAVMPLVATAAGGAQDTEVRRVTRMGMWLSIAFGVAALPLMWWSGAILTALGQADKIADLGQQYLRIAGFGIVPTLIVMVLKSYLAALGRLQVVFWVTVGAVGVNIGLNWMFIFGNFGAPEMGVRGAAIASLGVQTASAVALMIYAGTLPSLRVYALWQRFWRPDWTAMQQVYSLGWPIGLALLAETGLFAATSIMMGWFGARALAAHGIALELTAMFFMTHLGLSNAATVIVGRARGRSDPVALRHGAQTAIVLAMMIALLTVGIYYVFGTQMVGLFLSPQDPERELIVPLAYSLLMVAAVFQFADSAQVMAMGLLRGVQDTKVPMLIAAISYWAVGLPSSYFLGVYFGFGGVGVWAGLVVGLSLAAIMLNIRFWRRLSHAYGT